MPNRAATSAARAALREAMAPSRPRVEARMAGMTRLMAMLAVLKTPQESLCIGRF
jgi:hypothetical protein